MWTRITFQRQIYCYDCISMNMYTLFFKQFYSSKHCTGSPLLLQFFETLEKKPSKQLGPFSRTCNPSKWEADIWGWLEIRRSTRLHYTVNQHLYWPCWQYGHSGGTQGWLGVKRCQLSLQDTSRSAKWHRRAALGYWVSLCVKCCRMVDSVPR